MTPVSRAPQVAPGAPGQPRGLWGASAKAGAQGASGKLDEDDQIELGELGRACDDVFLLRLVQKCKFIYRFNSPTKFTDNKLIRPERWQELGDLLEWTIGVLRPFAQLAATPSLIDQRKNALYKTANNLYLSWAGWLTYDNVSPDWVPATPIKTMFDEFSRAFTGRSTREKRYLAMSKTYERAEEAQAALDDARHGVSDAMTLHRATYLALLQQLKDIPQQVAKAREACELAQRQLESSLSTLKNEVNAYYHCSLSDVLKAAEMLAFTAGDAKVAGVMGLVEIGSLINDGLAKIEINSGETINKSALFDEIFTVQGDIRTAVTGELFQLNDKHEMEFQPEKKLLLTEIGKLKEEVSRFSNALGSAVTNAVIKSLDDFTASIYDQGQALLMYNVMMMKMVEEYRAYEAAQAQYKALDSKKADPISPSWAADVSYFAKLYQDELDNTIAAVADLQRKAAYVTLDAQDDLNLMELMGKLWLVGQPPDATDMDDLERKVSKLRDQIKSYASGQSSAATPIPADKGKRSDLYVDISAEVLLEELKTCQPDGSYTVTFTTVPGKPETAHQVRVSNASKYYDIRVVAVQPRILGAKSGTGKVAIEVRVAARTMIIDKNGGKHSFYFGNFRDTGVVHKIDTTLEGETYDESGGSGGQLTDNYLDRVGLYGKWTLTCPPAVTPGDDNVKLDLSGVSGLRVYFDCYARHK